MSHTQHTSHALSHPPTRLWRRWSALHPGGEQVASFFMVAPYALAMPCSWLSPSFCGSHPPSSWRVRLPLHQPIAVTVSALINMAYLLAVPLFNCLLGVRHKVSLATLSPDELDGCGCMCRSPTELGAAPETLCMAAWEQHFVPRMQSSPCLGLRHCIILIPICVAIRARASRPRCLGRWDRRDLRCGRVVHTSNSILHRYEFIPPTPYFCFVNPYPCSALSRPRRTLARLAQLLVVTQCTRLAQCTRHAHGCVAPPVPCTASL